MLQFITNAPDKDSVIMQVQQVLAGGCKWIQLRMKNAEHNEIVETAKVLKPMCAEQEAIFVIDDHVDICKELALDGVHLGKNDMDVKEARELLGEGCIIGATANTLEDVLFHSPVYVDYIGLGPFRFTTTKQNLSPIIGLDGYRNIATVAASTGKNLPLVAIDDIIACLKTHIAHVAHLLGYETAVGEILGRGIAVGIYGEGHTLLSHRQA